MSDKHTPGPWAPRMNEFTIYLVTGQCGQYSDHVSWNIRAFRSKEAAQELVERLEKIANEVASAYSETRGCRMYLHECGDDMPFTPEWQAWIEKRDALKEKAGALDEHSSYFLEEDPTYSVQEIVLQ